MSSRITIEPEGLIEYNSIWPKDENGISAYYPVTTKRVICTLEELKEIVEWYRRKKSEEKKDAEIS